MQQTNHTQLMQSPRVVLGTMAVAILALVLLPISVLAGQIPLSYAEGGPAVEDPGQGQPHVRYVDARDGNDANTGLSPGSAWRSFSKVSAEASGLPAGTHVLFRRGRKFTGGKFRFENNRRGREGQRLVLGAYGPLHEARPRLLRSISIRNCAYVTVRDFDTEGIGISRAADHILIYNNVVHAIESPRLNNGIAVNDRAHHIALVSNLVYDIHQNDAISIHDKNWEPNPAPVGSAHWVIDNVLIGNRGMEEPIDVASGHGFTPAAQDIKIIGNRVSCPAVPGVSTLSGRANGGIVAMHDASHLWIMGNTVTGCGNRGIGLLANGADTRMGVQITGNVLYNNGRNNNVNLDLDISEMHVTHNTILHDVNTRNPIAIRADARRVTFSSNLVGVKEHNAAGWIAVDPTPAVALTDMNNNWYADLSGGSLTAVIDHRSLIRWQADTGFDVSSGEGVVPGVSIPAAAWADPHRWNDQAYLALFTPSASFIRCAGANIPGAFDCQGNRLGMTIRPSPGLSEDQGFGWSGPAIVQRRYPMAGNDNGSDTPPDDDTRPATTTLDARVAQSNDDAEERPAGDVNLTSKDLEMVQDGNADQTVGIRFRDLGIPQGATITNAYIQFTVDEANTQAASLTIEGEAVDNAQIFSTATRNISSRARTLSNTAVTWSPVSWNTVGDAGTDQRTPNLAAIVQAIVNRPNWASGQAMAFIITGSGLRVAQSYNRSPANAPVLHVEYQ